VKSRKWTIPAVALALAGCTSWWPWSSGPAEQARYPADARIYECDAGKRLVVRYLDGGKAAMVMYPEREFRLDQVPAASGARYSNDRTTLHTKGDEAFVEEDGKTVFANCRSAAK
jgi:membrane-bound inhibitor of C-type lysozyme